MRGISFPIFLFLLILAGALLAPRGAARGQSLPAEKLSWSGRDVAGRPVTIPAPGRSAVLLFIQPEQEQSLRTLAEVRTQFSQAADVQLVAIVSGRDAAARAQVRTLGPWEGALVADETWACSGMFDVHAWPTTVLLTPEGKLAGHLPGWSVAYGTKLAAYAAFAAGKTTRAQLETALTEQSVIEESTDQKASRHLMLAERFVASDRRADAAEQVRQALALAPAGDKVRLELARAELLLGQSRAADDLLQMLPPQKASAGELALLRGWAAQERGRWEQAKPLLEQAAASPACTAEAEYRLGLLYQHEGDATRAAAAFRQAFEATAPGRELAPAPLPPPPPATLPATQSAPPA